MSFGNQKIFSGVQEVLVLALMMVSLFALLYFPQIDMTYKAGIIIIAFAVIFLTTLATQILRAQKENRQAATKA